MALSVASVACGLAFSAAWIAFLRFDSFEAFRLGFVRNKALKTGETLGQQLPTIKQRDR
jgi:hypothetical protein